MYVDEKTARVETYHTWKALCISRNSWIQVTSTQIVPQKKKYIWRVYIKYTGGIFCNSRKVSYLNIYWNPGLKCWTILISHILLLQTDCLHVLENMVAGSSWTWLPTVLPTREELIYIPSIFPSSNTPRGSYDLSYCVRCLPLHHQL